MKPGLDSELLRALPVILLVSLLMWVGIWFSVNWFFDWLL